MIIIGFRKITFGESQPNDLKCPNCEKKGTTSIRVQSRHIQFFWIPTLAFGKTGMSECTNCEHQIKRKNLPLEFRQEYQNLKADNRPPLWQFTGLAIILCLAYLIRNRGISDELREREYLNKPMVNDLYSYKTPTHQYSTYKLKSYTTDSFVLFSSNCETNKILLTDKTEHDTCFGDSSFIIAREEMIALYDSGVVYHIIRKQNLENDTLN